MADNHDKPNGHATNGKPHGALARPADSNGGSAPTNGTAASWSVQESLAGRRILVTGTTGFLGKVYLSMVLHFHPDVEQVYLLIRPRPNQSAVDRFFGQIATSGALDPLREAHGEGYVDFLREKVTPLGGDITERFMGLDEDEARALSSRLDVFINSAGLTNFNPNLESALEINTLAQRNILEFIRLGDCHSSYLHVSTAFVAGNVSGEVDEVFPGPTRYPNYDDIGVEYDAEREIDDCLAMIDHARQLAEDQEHSTLFAQQAREKLRKKNLNPNDAEAFAEEVDRIRTKWLRDRLSHEGRDRAAFWGWPNIYTYTKSLGERLLAAASDEINLTIVRPAIVESGEAFPSVGWNEGINTSAPLVYLMGKGHRFIPTRREVNLDVIPVDYVAGAMVGVTAALIERRQHDVYHLGSSDRNPVSVFRLVELTNLTLRRHLRKESRKPMWQRALLASLDSVPVDQKTFEKRSAPGIHKAVKGLKGLLGKVPTKSLGGVGQAIDTVHKGLEGAEKVTFASEKIWELFLPFTHHNAYKFLARNIEALAAELPADERARYGSDIGRMDWREYWSKVHVPGLIKNVFPELDAKFRGEAPRTHTYADLIELFEASTHNFADRVALQHHSGGIIERYTYAEMGERARQVADALGARGIVEHAPVLLVSENRPQWAMAYFGILKAGAVCVPVDPESSVDQIVNVVRSADAHGVVVSQEVRARLGASLDARLAELDEPVLLVTLGELFEAEAGVDAVVDREPPAEIVRAAADGDPLASLIYTSGTTGRPKGVMLTHQNFTALLASLQQTFKINERDGFLSVLPLHHTFEFTCGFLMPLSKGASITYLDELSAEELNGALNSTRITALIAVPALWQLLNRRVKGKLADAPPALRWTVNNLLEVNASMRERFGLNLGKTFFGAIHNAFGGKLRYLISGGAALPSDVLKAFYGMGFNLYEGYGLTEAAPVLTVNRPERGFHPGKVGEALPGIEVKIDAPNDAGVGEVLARGKNVMKGYLGLSEETERALDADGWLRTGDLGRIDDGGRLEIVGRAKEVIVTSGGKNVYPDELEEVYGGCDEIAELSVVGLPDGSGSERVAALVRPELPEDATAEQVAEVRGRIREQIRVEGSRMAGHNRIRVLRFWDEEFPRTPTRKIKRSEIIKILERLHAAEHAEHAGDEEVSGQWAWLYRQIAKLADLDASKIHPGMHFVDDLGFDSLMVVELASLLETRDYHVSTEQLSQVYTVGDLERLLGGDGPDQPSTALVHVGTRPTHERVDEYPIPRLIAQLGSDLLDRAQIASYDRFFDVEVYGRANIPYHDPNVIVVANHASHLDMGLVKYALGDWGKEVRALAAADYFFSDPVRKTYFKNFTNLIPVERSGSLEQALSGASEALERGEMLLLFPEGTRSIDGKLKEFRRGLGYLATAHRVSILPLYIEGTHRALPKGRTLPNPMSRKLKVHIGRPLPAHELMRETASMTSVEAYDYVSQKGYEAVAGLRDASQPKVDADEDLGPLFGELNDKFASEAVSDEMSFYFSLGNVDSHKWTVTVTCDGCQIYQGKPSGRADCVIKTSPDIFKKIVRESYVPSMDEFMSGKIKTNDPQLLMQFQSVFRLS